MCVYAYNMQIHNTCNTGLCWFWCGFVSLFCWLLMTLWSSAWGYGRINPPNFSGIHHGMVPSNAPCMADLPGWWLNPTPLKNMTSSVGIIIPTIGENKIKQLLTCLNIWCNRSKSATRQCLSLRGSPTIQRTRPPKGFDGCLGLVKFS